MSLDPVQEHLFSDLTVSLTYFVVTALTVLAVDVLRKWLYKKIDDKDDDKDDIDDIDDKDDVDDE